MFASGSGRAVSGRLLMRVGVRVAFGVGLSLRLPLGMRMIIRAGITRTGIGRVLGQKRSDHGKKQHLTPPNINSCRASNNNQNLFSSS